MSIRAFGQTVVLAVAASLLAFSFASTVANAAGGTPYQGSVLSKCGNGGGLRPCRYTFPAVPANKRLDIEFVSCAVETSVEDPAYVSVASLGVNNGFNFPLAYLAWRSRVSNNAISLTISQPVVFSIRAGAAPQVAFEYSGTLSAILGCSISGEMVSLK